MVAPDSLEHLTFFSRLEPRERELLAPISERRRYAAGETIFQEDERVDSLRILVEGLVSFRQCQRTGDEQVTIGNVSDSGAAFGITALVAPRRPGPHSAVAVENTEVVEIDGAKLLDLFEREPAVGVRLLLELSAVMAERLTAAREQLRSRVHPGLISHG